MEKTDPLYLTYVAMVGSMNHDMKLTLLGILAESLQADRKNENQEEKTEEQKESWLHLAGSWEGDETAEEIISMIKDKPISQLF